MPQPASHYYHVTLRASGLAGEVQDFKLPNWSPGYYRLIDYAANIRNFYAEDGEHRAEPWEKTAKNTWRIASGNTPTLILTYDVAANAVFGVQNFVDETRAYLSPAGVYLYPAGHIASGITVTFQLPSGWKNIATGLDPVPDGANSFSARDFDILYDCPTLMGNQETLEFTVLGRPHRVVLENVPPTVDRPKMLGDLKRIVEAATTLIGDIPYSHYTFLMMGTGNGGIEHLNSASISFNGKSLESPDGYLRWLSYVAHEYFHNFNVKRIRPIALGPFDYDRENLTDMLWVSEGLSVYYQDLLLVRAGLMTRDQYLQKMQTAIARFENASGHHYQSATDSSRNTWGTSGVGGDRNTTISYYDNGGMLGAMLDLEIRSGSDNRHSLDDVMRALYRKYYLQGKRGFTDAEFRAECDAATTADLTEIFEYATTSRDVDYAKYFGLAGLTLESSSEDAPGTWIGLDTQTQDGELAVVYATPASPADTAGLKPGDHITAIEGKPATVQALAGLLATHQPGETIVMKVGSDRDVTVTLAKNFKRTYAFHSSNENPILKDWLRNQNGRQE